MSARNRFPALRRCATWHVAVFFAVLPIWGFVPPASAALQPDQIALVVNTRVPESRELAEFYAAKRNIPADRIIALDLPFPGEEIAFERYDADVVPVVRKFLRDKGLREKVTCLVTFWGVPLRIGRRNVPPEEARQLDVIGQEIQKTKDALDAAVTQSEALAREVAGTFEPGQGKDLPQLAKRAGDAMTAALRSIMTMREGERRDGLFRRLIKLLEQVSGEPEVFERLENADFAKLSPEPVTPQQIEASRKKATQWKQDFQAAQAKPVSPQTFETMREIVRSHFGLFRYLALLQAQQVAFDPKETESAFDSELALVWWDNHYARNRWQGNPLSFKVRDVPAGTPATLMVMRLDGPTAESVDRLISSSLKAEKQGLQGQVVIDARGIHGNNYGKYDDTLRSLAELLQAKTKLQVMLDDKDAVIQPGPAAPKGVAIYCGWYSLRNYVPALQFNEGAVGFHVASSELVSLRGENERGWVRGLLNDGICATLGPVAEPYLHSFPPADEFFPLLMTGKLTLAEVYWKTNPLTSWMNACIGDPLYTPYKVNPPLKVEDLPEKLRVAVDNAAVAPQSEPPKVPAPKPPAPPATSPQ